MSGLQKGEKRRRSRRSLEKSICEINGSFRPSEDLSADKVPQIQKRSSRRSVKRVKYAELAGVTENQVLDDEENEDETLNEDMEEKQHQNNLHKERKRGRPGVDLEIEVENFGIIDTKNFSQMAGIGFSTVL